MYKVEMKISKDDYKLVSATPCPFRKESIRNIINDKKIAEEEEDEKKNRHGKNAVAISFQKNLWLTK
jgi:hypothetical protein